MVIGDTVIYAGEAYTIVGFTPVSVRPAEVQLRPGGGDDDSIWVERSLLFPPPPPEKRSLRRQQKGPDPRNG